MSAPTPLPRSPGVAVVGHVEWVRFARVARIPRPGEITHARDPFDEPAGGGAVAAVQLARLAGAATLLTALGDDELGRRAAARLEELGVSVRAVWREQPTRSAVTLVDDDGERTITTFGSRLEPRGADAKLPWSELADMDSVYFTAGDLAALRAARAARVLVASPRAIDALGHGVPLDALVSSAEDATEHEQAERVRAGGEAELLLETEGHRGGLYSRRDGASGCWKAARAPGGAVDSYGCGDSFAAGLSFALGARMQLEEAIELAARCGAVCLTGRGPYERQLSAREPTHG